MELSIVSTLYCSEPHIAEFHRRVAESARALVGEDYEIILVNDGSPDGSLDVAKSILTTDSHLRVIDLSRNFGHHHAMICGLQHARGNKVFLLDSDLEEDPAWLLQFAETLKRKECDAVFGVQKRRKGGIFERLTGWVFYRLYNVLTGFDFPKNIVTARLMTREFLQAFLQHREREISIGGLFYITGFMQCSVTVKKVSLSPSTYNLRRKFAVFVNSVVSFTSRPLVGIFFFGLLVLMVSMLVSVYYTINAIAFGRPPDGWTSLMVSVWLLGGLIISSIGVVGIYVSKVFVETKQRPNTIIRQIYKFEGTQQCQKQV